MLNPTQNLEDFYEKAAGSNGEKTLPAASGSEGVPREPRLVRDDSVDDLNRIVRKEVKEALREELQRIKIPYRPKRKKPRVIYVPKDPLTEAVFKRLRKSEDEPLKVTFRKLVEVAAKSLKVEERKNA